jgi:hypothetical protein
MVLRLYEKFVKDSLVKYFGGSDVVKAWEGEDPPDIYINVQGETVAVEITRLSPVSFDQEGSIENRSTQDYFGINLCDELDSKLKCYVPAEIDIILTLYVPVGNARKYKSELYSCLKDFIDKGPKAGDREEIKIAGEKVNISIVPNRDHSQKRIVGIIVNKNSDPHILSNAEVILAGRIKEKQEKCKKIQHDGPIWLALFNDYWLADHETYAQAIRNISLEHEFKKIFLVLDTGSVHQIYEKI